MHSPTPFLELALQATPGLKMKGFLRFQILSEFEAQILKICKKQAEAEVVQSSSLVEVVVEVGVEVWVEVGVEF